MDQKPITHRRTAEQILAEFDKKGGPLFLTSEELEMFRASVCIPNIYCPPRKPLGKETVHRSGE